MRKIAIALLAVVPAIVGISGCGGGEKAKSVNLSKRAPVQRSATLPRENPLRIAVGAMITPKEGFAYYRRLFDYIEGQLGMPVKLVDRENYRRTNNLIRKQRSNLKISYEQQMNLLDSTKFYSTYSYDEFIVTILRNLEPIFTFDQ